MKGQKVEGTHRFITHCISKDYLPINVVEAAGFKKMIDSRYEILGRNLFSRIALPSLCASVKQQVKQDVSALQCFLASTDMWSSMGMQPYMSYTIH